MKYFFDTEFHEYQKKHFFGKPTDTIDLISIGIVSEDDREYYALHKDCDIKAAWNNTWLRENVLKPIYLSKIGGDGRNWLPFSLQTMKGIFKGFGKTKYELREDILMFVLDGGSEGLNSWNGGVNDWLEYLWKKYEPKDKPEFWAYYADYDWVVFCWIFGRMIDLPKAFPMYCRDIKQKMDNMSYCQIQLHKGSSRLKSWLSTIKNHPKYPKNGNEHNALADAKWNKELHKFLCVYPCRYMKDIRK